MCMNVSSGQTKDTLSAKGFGVFVFKIVIVTPILQSKRSLEPP